MVRIKQLMVGATLTAAAAVVPASAAFASGPGGGSGNGSGNNGRSQQTLICGGQTYTVAVTNGGNALAPGRSSTPTVTASRHRGPSR